MALLPPVVLELRAKATELFATEKEVVASTKDMADQTEKHTSRMGTAFQGAASAGKGLAVGIVGAAGVVAGFSIDAAQAAQVTEAKLSVAIKNAGGNYDALKPKIEAADATQRQFGYTNDQTNAALATLTTALHSPTKALADMNIVTNLARMKGIDLSQAAILVAKTSEGQSRALKQLGIDLPTVNSSAQAVAAAQQKLAAAQAKENSIADQTPTKLAAIVAQHKQLAAAQAAVNSAQTALSQKQNAGATDLAALTERVKGSATAFGSTLAGQMAAAKAGVDNIGEQIGGVLIPIIEKVIQTLQVWAGWLAKNQGVLIALASVVGGVVAILITAYVAQKAIAAGMAVMRAATVAYNLVAGAFGIVTKASTAASYGQVGATYASVAAQKAYSIGLGISKVATTVATAAQWLFNAALDANPIGIVVLAIAALVAGLIWFFTQTKLGKEIWKDFSGFIVDAVKNVGNWFGSVFKAIGGFVTDAFKGAANFIIGFFNFITDTINSVIGGLDDAAAGIKNITGGAINFSIGKLPHIPSFDVGGTVPGPTGAPMLIRAHGGEEVLSNAMLAGKQPVNGRAQSAIAASTKGPSHVDNSKHITVNATTNASAKQIAHEAGWELRLDATA